MKRNAQRDGVRPSNSRRTSSNGFGVVEHEDERCLHARDLTIAPWPDLTVVGSINLDLVAKVERLPRAGETLSGATLERIPGGKGANQAVAAARLGADVRMVGCVGRDANADDALAGLREAACRARRPRGRTRRPGSRSSSSPTTARTRSSSSPARTREVGGFTAGRQRPLPARDPRLGRRGGASAGRLALRQRRAGATARRPGGSRRRESLRGGGRSASSRCSR